MKLFSIRVKELFEPIVLQKEGDFSVTPEDLQYKTQNWEAKFVFN